eukprot:COSAG01_NODE_70973_length_257_cov_0.658228_1_plen_47_part_10
MQPDTAAQPASPGAHDCVAPVASVHTWPSIVALVVRVYVCSGLNWFA